MIGFEELCLKKHCLIILPCPVKNEKSQLSLRKYLENGNILEAAQIIESEVPVDNQRYTKCCGKCSYLQRTHQIDFDL